MAKVAATQEFIPHCQERCMYLQHVITTVFRVWLSAAVLRGAALARGRIRAVYPVGVGLQAGTAAAAFRHPSPLATAATGLPYATWVIALSLLSFLMFGYLFWMKWQELTWVDRKTELFTNHCRIMTCNFLFLYSGVYQDPYLATAAFAERYQVTSAGGLCSLYLSLLLSKSVSKPWMQCTNP